MSYTEKLSFNIDWKRKTFILHLDDGTALPIKVDDDAIVSGYIELESFKELNLGTLTGFTESLREILSKDQMALFFEICGNSSAIKISSVAMLFNGDRALAKKALDLGIMRGVLANGINSTWKVVNKEEQKTMKTASDRLKKGGIVDSRTWGNILEKVKDRDEVVEEVEEEEVVVVEEEKEFQTMTRYVRPVEEKVAKQVKSVKQAVTIIAEKKDHSSMSEGDLRRELKALQHELEVDKWGEDRTPWAVNDEIQLVKAQLNGFENRRNAEKYKKEVNSLSPIVPEKKGVQGKSQILPKKKPLQALTPVVKKRS